MTVETLPNRTYLTAHIVRETGIKPQLLERSVPRDTIAVSASGFEAADRGEPTPRSALLDRIRREVAAGAYVTPAKLDAATERLTAEISKSESVFD